MIDSQHITCDVRGIAKGETNHWLAYIVPVDAQDPSTTGIGFGPLAAQVDDETGLYKGHLCGQACAHTRLSQWFTSLTATAATERQSE